MAVIVVLWVQNKVAPIEQQIDCATNATIPLRQLQSVCSSHPKATYVSVFNVESGTWNALCIDEDIVIPTGEDTILMRMPGVTRCPDFGAELENIYQHLPLPSYEPQTPASELITPVQKQYLVEKRVVLWHKDGSLPVVFAICMTKTFEVKWSIDTTITSHLDGAFAFDMWDLDLMRWTLMSATDTVRLPQDQRSVLLRRVAVRYTVGLGREIVALQAQVERFQQDLEEPLLHAASGIYKCSPPRRLMEKRGGGRRSLVYHPCGRKSIAEGSTSSAKSPVEVKAHANNEEGEVRMPAWDYLGRVDELTCILGTDQTSVRHGDAQHLPDHVRTYHDTKKTKVAFVGRVSDVERVLRWKKRSGMPLGDVDEAWRVVLPPDLFESEPSVLGDKSNPIDVDHI